MKIPGLKLYFTVHVFILLFIFLGACTSVDTAPDSSHPVFLTDEHIAHILPANRFLDNAEIMQLITGDYNGTEYIMQTLVILNENEVIVTAYSTFGNTLYTLEYRDDLIEYDSFLDVQQSGAAYVLADIQMCYYPVDQVRFMIESAGLAFLYEDTGTGWIRTISNDGEIVIQIRKDGPNIHYSNFLRNYHYSIEEL